MRSFRKTAPHGRLMLAAALLLVPGTVRATWIEGKVFCDDGDSRFDGGDTGLDGVTMEAVSLDADPGTTFTDTTGDAVPVSPAVRGYYRIMLPHVDDTYRVRPRSGLPPGSTILVPASGESSASVDSGTGDPSNARKTRNFLVGGCDGSATTSTTTPGAGNTTTSTTTTGGNGSTTTTTTGSTSTTIDSGGPGGPGGPDGPGENPVPPNCGDGVLNLDEECDDGNQVAGDGCDAACASEDTAETWSINIRVRHQRDERLEYVTHLRALPSSLLGTAPVHLTLTADEFQLLDAQIPASAFRVKPQPVLAQPDGRRAKAVGEFGIWRIKLTLTPVTGLPAYDARLVVKGEMLPSMFKMLRLTAVIQIGDVVYTATDRIKANRTGQYLRYIHPVLDD